MKLRHVLVAGGLIVWALAVATAAVAGYREGFPSDRPQPPAAIPLHPTRPQLLRTTPRNIETP